VLNQILTSLEVTFCDAHGTLLLLFGEDLFNLAFEVLDLLHPPVGFFNWDLSTDHLGALVAGSLHSLLDDFAVRFCGERTGSTTSSSTGGTTDTMEVDLVTLWCFVVDDCRDVLDVETTRGNVSS
jgi:hypothetical protein